MNNITRSDSVSVGGLPFEEVLLCLLQSPDHFESTTPKQSLSTLALASEVISAVRLHECNVVSICSALAENAKRLRAESRPWFKYALHLAEFNIARGIGLDFGDVVIKVIKGVDFTSSDLVSLYDPTLKAAFNFLSSLIALSDVRDEKKEKVREAYKSLAVYLKLEHTRPFELAENALRTRKED